MKFIMLAYTNAQTWVEGTWDPEEFQKACDFYEQLGKDLAATGVLVNCIAPAVIATPMLEQMSSEHVDYMVSKIPMSRVGQPEEVAELIAFLASDRMTFSTGATFDISGGRAVF